MSVVSQPGIRILLVEDHPMARAGLELFLQAYPDFQLVGLVGSGEEAITFCEDTEPDVILMDMKLPGIDGVDTTARILRVHPGVQIVALTSFQELELVDRAFRAGVCSYVLKTSPPHVLLDAIRTAYVPKQPHA